MSLKRILFIDAYDSFTNNIISLVETELNVEITTIHIDEEIEDLDRFLQPFDAVIAGPGPGNPTNPQDVGLIARLWELEDSQVKPILGICLGFQSLVHAFGGLIEPLSAPRHGISTRIDCCGHGLFDGLTSFESVQYHSLQGIIGQAESPWQTTSQCPELVPLAWDNSLSETQGPILMSVGHISKPFWGIQFHPESICSSRQARQVISNWWVMIKDLRYPQCNSSLRHSVELEVGMSDCSEHLDSGHISPTSFPGTPFSGCSVSSTTSYGEIRETMSFEKYVCRVMDTKGLDVPNVVDTLDMTEAELIVLDSEKKLMPALGRYSIIGIVSSETTKLTYRVGSGVAHESVNGESICMPVENTKDVFTYMKTFLDERKLSSGPQEIPFWGGFIGYIDYEASLETIQIDSKPQDVRDNLCFAFIERSLVVDHLTGKIYIQSIKPHDSKWIESTSLLLTNPMEGSFKTPSAVQVTATELPKEIDYKLKIAHCQEQIRAGNSYELCLTNQARFRAPKRNSSWQKYQSLRSLNPAPFSSYIRMNAVTVLSTSPERFMHWTRPSLCENGQMSSTCQFRPIKGTVQKMQSLPDGTTRDISLTEAKAVLSTTKETAENLMIVDLIRHDLHNVVGPGKVRVPSLMQVEEYSTVYQLVSVIEGDLLTTPGTGCQPTGLDVLATSLPPGSMTGAPKKRSCKILQQLEDEPRSLYSGVIGYMCVGGGGDFSVTIRTVFKWDDEDTKIDGEELENWRIGAGGAITILSDFQDEWEEMQGKLSSTRRLFEQ